MKSLMRYHFFSAFFLILLLSQYTVRSLHISNKIYRQNRFVCRSSSPSDVEDDTTATTKSSLRSEGPKYLLVSALKDQQQKNDLVAGFGTSDSDRSRITKLAKDLSESNYVSPLLSSEWKLVYNDAPDVLGFRGGPLSKLLSIRQKINVNDNKLEMILEYKPSDGVSILLSSLLPAIEDDRLEQTVSFECETQPMNKFNLVVKGNKIDSSRFGSTSNLQSPVSLPFGSYKVTFNDDDLCIQETIQGGFLFIYQRIL
mmetsp:Transcript_36911/g.42100  ORF Transcript_36911/g.42100 Transcript_36911/m.42100 type:complete len:256 (-) Transcript_36911:139-906(-)